MWGWFRFLSSQSKPVITWTLQNNILSVMLWGFYSDRKMFVLHQVQNVYMNFYDANFLYMQCYVSSHFPNLTRTDWSQITERFLGGRGCWFDRLFISVTLVYEIAEECYALVKCTNYWNLRTVVFILAFILLDVMVCFFQLPNSINNSFHRRYFSVVFVILTLKPGQN